ncbi:hypothetical protein QR680_018927 [Steinernema hermaphroditum]|uniref:Uncharacterized protein n=1 Tax=Steinernema hermaphroditum TaxID=289476 RepID=A0AA39HKF6_9BILA|nr:hypothetical protein QR680_018927 [Steinernema hermaphroditum]
MAYREQALIELRFSGVSTGVRQSKSDLLTDITLLLSLRTVDACDGILVLGSYHRCIHVISGYDAFAALTQLFPSDCSLHKNFGSFRTVTRSFMLSIALFLLFTLATAVPSPNVTTVDPSRRLFFVGVGGEVLRTGKNKDRCITMMVGSRYPNNRSPEPFDFPVAAHCRHDVLKAKLRCEFFQFSSLSRSARCPAARRSIDLCA